jgi:hypothetical protein
MEVSSSFHSPVGTLEGFLPEGISIGMQLSEKRKI